MELARIQYLEGDVERLLKRESDKIKGLRAELEGVYGVNDELWKENRTLSIATQELHAELADARAKLAEALNELGEATTQYERPTFLNRTAPYQPKRYYNTGWVTFPPTKFYDVPEEIRDYVKNKGWARLDHDEKLVAIWQHVMSEYKYATETKENWQFALETFHRKKGDCEDTTILFLVMLRAAGVPPTKAFNACGTVKTGSQSYGHSYPVCKMEDGVWRVFETTINWASNPKQWRGSGYEGEWGLQNWYFSGRLKQGVDLLDE